jgi:hypothetical protein
MTSQAHPLVEQLRFARHEFRRALAGVSDADARERLGPMNCISWNVGHLAWQEQRYWLYRGQGEYLIPEVNEQFAYGAPGFTPPLASVWKSWKAITAAADLWLDTVTSAKLQEFVVSNGRPTTIMFGNLLNRTVAHYWYHTGENMAIRQSLGHKKLPEFVGDIDGRAPYRPA